VATWWLINCMKASVILLAVVATALLAGCDKSKSKSDYSVNYLGTVVNAQKASEKKIDVAYLNQAVQLFQAQEGRLPKSLDELVPNYVGKLPETPYGTKLSYDPATGTVKVVNQ